MLVHGVGLMGVWCSPCFCLSSSLSEWRMRRRKEGGGAWYVLLQGGLKEAGEEEGEDAWKS